LTATTFLGVLIARVAIVILVRVSGVNPNKYLESRVSHSAIADTRWSNMRLGRQPLDTRNILKADARGKAEQSSGNSE
jgi:hypothetical protein